MNECIQCPRAIPDRKGLPISFQSGIELLAILIGYAVRTTIFFEHPWLHCLLIQNGYILLSVDLTCFFDFGSFDGAADGFGFAFDCLFLSEFLDFECMGFFGFLLEGLGFEQ